MILRHISWKLETFGLDWLLSRVCVETMRETSGKLRGNHKSFRFPVYRVETWKL
jgi:hypothetical protein